MNTHTRWIAKLAFSVSGPALILLTGPVLAQDTMLLPQAWTPQQIRIWYTTSQGSRLIPYAWLQALEQPGSQKRFLDPEHMASLRYLRGPAGGTKGDLPLPLGFVVDVQDDSRMSEQQTRLRWKTKQTSNEPWVGMNCAACHTGEISYRDKRMRIEGAPTLADFQTFLESFTAALIETKDKDDKWDRFAAAVLKGADTSANRALLRASLSTLLEWQLKLNKANGEPAPIRYGFGRLDAIGHIYNKVAVIVEAADQKPNPSDAPVSYPFLWNISQFDKVQWNGVAENKPVEINGRKFDIGALGRNTGEVIGVFGDVKLNPLPLLSGYRSSIRVADLKRLDDQLATLLPPAWPEAILGGIDPGKRDRGKQLFVDKGCARCHEPLARDNLSKRIITKMALFKEGRDAPGTDIWMACNAYTYEARTGLMWGMPRLYIDAAHPLRGTASLADMLGTTVAGVLVGKKHDVAKSIGDTFFNRRAEPSIAFSAPADLSLPDALRPSPEQAKQQRRERCLSDDSPILGYKARPLTGIWATAPYLHNGSVPTLYDLLLPPDQRPQSFFVGSREFDPDKVGYVTGKSADNTFEFKTGVEGNSNAGHDYGNSSLSPEDRAALVEYLKSL
jgi:hypothetical protein